MVLIELQEGRNDKQCLSRPYRALEGSGGLGADHFKKMKKIF